MGKRRKKKGIPQLVRLRYAPVGRDVFCELCGSAIKVGQFVAWWEVPRWNGPGRRKTAYCPTCHSECARKGRALR